MVVPAARLELVVRVVVPTSMVREERATLQMFKPVPRASLFLVTEAETETTPVFGPVVEVVELDPKEQLLAMELAEQVDLVTYRT